MKKSTYSRCREMVSTVKKSTARMLAACARRNARHERPERSSAGPSLAQQLAHSCRRDLDPEPAQFADDALISPARVLARQPQH
jgi:hypothetical protein